MYLATRLTWILPLFQLLMTLLVRLVVAPVGEGLGAEGAGDGALAAHALAAHGAHRQHLGPRHAADVATVPAVLV